MSWLWKPVLKSFQYFARSTATTSETKATLSCTDILVKLIPTHSVLKNSLKKCTSYSSKKKNFDWSSLSAKSIFFEICGLSSVVALGWEYGRYKRNCISSHNQYNGLCKSILSLNLPKHPFYFKHTQLNINNQQSSLNFFPINRESTTATGSNLNKDYKAETEIEKTLIGMVQDLERGSFWGLSQLQNMVGVELINSAQGKDLSNIEITCSGSSLLYQKEAFECFQESMKLGSTEGAYNSGICYEQGIGTDVNIDKAIVCYEEAAIKNHPGAQYNLGLLYYQRYVRNEKGDNSDLRSAFSLLHQAGQNGLQQAWSAIMTFFDNEVAQVDATSCSIVDYSDANESTFRKTSSEPCGLSYLSSESSHTSEMSNPCHGAVDATNHVCFYLDN